MIHDHDRSGWFGASDTSMVMGNWETTTFKRWWAQKLGLNTDHFSTPAMNAGTYYEGRILDAIEAPRRDHQILIPALRLRINLDGDAPGRIYEVKTFKAGKIFKPSKAYRQQVMAQMFGKLYTEHVLPLADIVAYPLGEAEYKNFFLPVDPEKITWHPIEYDYTWGDQYLHRLAILATALEHGSFPVLED